MEELLYSISAPPFATDATAHYPYSPGLEAALTFESRYDGVVKLTERRGDTLLVPRRLAPSLGQDMRAVVPLPAIDCKKGPRSAEQKDCIEKSIGYLKQGYDHVVEAPTGFGKTYIGAAVACAMGQATLVVVPKSDLMDQWRNTFINLVGIDPEEIGIAQAEKLDYKGKRFVLATVQSLIRPDKYDSEFFAAFGMVIFDETHRMAAECFSRACILIPAKYRLGLSATPKRNDGKTPVIAAHIGPVLVRGVNIPMSPKILIERTGWKIPQWMRRVEPGRMMGVYQAMARDPKRNAIILKFVLEAYRAGRTIVVMGDTVDHLKHLNALCGTAGVAWDQMGFYIGEIAKPLLKQNANKRVVFATYGMCGEGTDYPQWDTMVMVTPRANIKQPLGRILRSMEGKRQPVCLDLVDEGSILRHFSLKRQTQYHEVKAQLVNLS